MAEQPHIMVVQATFYEDIAEQLARGAVAALEEANSTHETIRVPGSLEIPAAIAIAVRSPGIYTGRRRFDGYVALGCVIRGETTHYDYVCQESARALQDLACRYCLAVGYGILTVENKEQAWERAAVDRLNRGRKAAAACLEMIGVKRHFGMFPR